MPSDVEICSAALIELGSPPFTSFAEASERDDVLTVSIKYPLLRNSILAKHDWTFASKREKLTREATAPASGWKYSFVLPPARMRGGWINLYNDSSVDARPISHYRIEGTKVLANDEELWAVYAYQAPEGNWPEWFVHFMTKALASECAMAVTDQANLKATLREEAFGPPTDEGRGGLFGECMTLDSQQDEAEGFNSFPLEEVRY